MVNTILFFIGVLFAIVICMKLHLNIGIVALAIAFLLGTITGGATVNGIISLFPIPLFFNFFLATFLFGFASENGTLKKVAENLFYYFRNMHWAIGLLFFVVTFVVSALGAAGAAPLFVSALCFSLAAQVKINTLLVPVAIWTGSMVGGGMPWSSGYATNVGQLQIYYSAEESSYMVYSFFGWRAVFYTLFYLVMFFVLKGWKVGRGTLIVEQPEPMNYKQKITLKIILVIIALVLISAILPKLIPVATVNKICSNLSFQFLATIGILVNTYLATADYKKVVTQRIPWDTLIMLSTMGIYMSLAKTLGIVDYMVEVLQNDISPGMILPGIVLIMTVLSFFVSGGVIVPMIIPLLPALSVGSGISATAIYVAAQIGLTASSISPFSQGGASVLTGCQDDEVRNKLLQQQVVLSIIIGILITLISMAGGFNMFL